VSSRLEKLRQPPKRLTSLGIMGDQPRAPWKLPNTTAVLYGVRKGGSLLDPQYVHGREILRRIFFQSTLSWLCLRDVTIPPFVNTIRESSIVVHKMCGCLSNSSFLISENKRICVQTFSIVECYMDSWFRHFYMRLGNSPLSLRY